MIGKLKGPKYINDSCIDTSFPLVLDFEPKEGSTGLDTSVTIKLIFDRTLMQLGDTNVTIGSGSGEVVIDSKNSRGQVTQLRSDTALHPDCMLHHRASLT